MKHLSLFSGIGGIDLAAEWAGFESVAFVERDKFCQQVLSKNFPGIPIFGDVCEFDGTEYENKIDLVSAGFPCQPFSQAGKRKGASDERALWPQVCRILRETKPQWFLGENVPGLLTIDGGQYFGQILNDLAEIGYSVGWIVYGAKDVGAVHRRNRVFIVANASSVRLSGIQEEELRGQDDQERQEGREVKFERGGLREYVGHSESESGSQTDSPTCPERSQRDARENIGSRHWQSIATDSEGNSNGRQLQSRLWSVSEAKIATNNATDSEGEPSNGDKPRLREFTQPSASQSRSGDCKKILGGDWKQWGISPTIGIEPRVRGSNDGVPNRVDRLKSLGNAVVPQQVYPILVEIARQMK